MSSQTELLQAGHNAVPPGLRSRSQLRMTTAAGGPVAFVVGWGWEAGSGWRLGVSRPDCVTIESELSNVRTEREATVTVQRKRRAF